MTSHLPHFIAFALVSALSESNIDANKFFRGEVERFHENRIKNDVKMWKDIFSYNNENLSALDKFIDKVLVLKKFIEENDSEQIEKFIENAKSLDLNL